MSNSTYFQANSSKTSCSDCNPRVPRYLAIFVFIFVAISILAGGFGNIRVCVLLWKRQNLRRVPHYLLGSLALTGVLSALLAMPLLILMTTVSYFQLRDLPAVEIFCKVEFPFSFAFGVQNALTLSLMAFDRQECVLRPFSRRLTTMNVKKIIPVTWTITFLTAVVFAVLIRNEPCVCIAFYPYNNIYKLNNVFLTLMAVVGQLDTVTIIVIIVTFFRIVKELRSASSRVNPLNSVRHRNEKKLTELTYKICGIFLFFRVPVMFCHLLTKIKKFQGNFIVNAATLVTVTLVNFVYVTNPVFHHKMLNVSVPRPGGHSRQAEEPVEAPERNAETDQSDRVSTSKRK